MWARRFNLTLHRASGLSALLAAAGVNCGESIDLENLIGRACLVTVEHNDGNDARIYANISSVAKLPRDMSQITIEGHVRRDGSLVPPIVSRPRAAPAATARLNADGVSEDDLTALGDDVPHAATPAEAVLEPAEKNDVPF
jgi:hypothetical protein